MLKKFAAEWLGTLFLVAGIVGSGIIAQQLSGGNVALTLLAVSMVCGAILIVTILMLADISGAHLNPAVTAVLLMRKEIRSVEAAGYIVAQILGGITGVLIANVMFQEPALIASTTSRTGITQWLGEFVATFGLLAAILGCRRSHPNAIAYVVGVYIFAGFWFTSSGSFANPAVVIGRSMTDTFTGIMPAHTIGFIVAEILGAISASYFFAWLHGKNVEKEIN